MFFALYTNNSYLLAKWWHTRIAYMPYLLKRLLLMQKLRILCIMAATILLLQRRCSDHELMPLQLLLLLLGLLLLLQLSGCRCCNCLLGGWLVLELESFDLFEFFEIALFLFTLWEGTLSIGQWSYFGVYKALGDLRALPLSILNTGLSRLQLLFLGAGLRSAAGLRKTY